MLLRTRKERQLRRIPVARHESFEITPIPRFLLRAQYLLDGSLRTVFIGRVHRSLATDVRSAKEKEEKNEKAGDDKPVAHAKPPELDK
jgi:hypothetical protein